MSAENYISEVPHKNIQALEFGSLLDLLSVNLKYKNDFAGSFERDFLKFDMKNPGWVTKTCLHAR